MPERFEIYIVYKRRYINTLPFLSFLYNNNCIQMEHASQCPIIKLTGLGASYVMGALKASTRKQTGV